MRSGVSIIDPATTWIDVTADLGRDAVIEPNTHLRGATTVGENAVVGPDTTIVDSAVGAGATVLRAHVLSSAIGPSAQVGPYAYLRPGSAWRGRRRSARSWRPRTPRSAPGAKVPHLSYVGDATIGEGTNIGAATVSVNYDGVNKYRTDDRRATPVPGRTRCSSLRSRSVSGAYTAAGSIHHQGRTAGRAGRRSGAAAQRRRLGAAQTSGYRRCHRAAESIGDCGSRDCRGSRVALDVR